MFTIRRASEKDWPAILALRRGERLNPDLPPWDAFTVAVIGRAVVGAAAVRVHRDGTREIGSLVVDPAYRGQGVAALMLHAILAEHRGEMFMITGRAYAGHYARFGFLRIAAWRAPLGIAIHAALGSAFGWVMSRVQRRAFNRLAILRRAARTETPRDFGDVTIVPDAARIPVPAGRAVRGR